MSSYGKVKSNLFFLAAFFGIFSCTTRVSNSVPSRYYISRDSIVIVTLTNDSLRCVYAGDKPFLECSGKFKIKRDTVYFFPRDPFIVGNMRIEKAYIKRDTLFFRGSKYYKYVPKHAVREKKW
jgi:hypothetical protein